MTPAQQRRHDRARLRAAYMLALYFCGYTHKQIGERFGCSKQRAGQIFKRRERA